ncbi:unnamed protein product [Sphagnum troendelagicum]
MKKNANHWMIEYGILGQIGCLLFTNGVNLAMQSSQMVAKGLYETLGLHKGANPKEIKFAYYQLAKKYHPDVNEGNLEAEKKFQDVQ